MRKKVIVTLFVAFLAIATISLAQTVQTEKKVTQKCFVDTNKNNTCDKLENKICKIGNGTGYSDCKTNKNPRK